tara:strand:+ start:283 stop:393 length:111 start_codon:yes stop_codon:yes gene_type:complete
LSVIDKKKYYETTLSGMDVIAIEHKSIIGNQEEFIR